MGGYLLFALWVGFWFKQKASKDRTNYFLAGRNIPWWWAGISIAATTFAADTPLLITGIVAHKGLSGNWKWYALIGVHAAVVVFFASFWSRSKIITDAELISIRYSGRPAVFLRFFRAFINGIVINAIVLGWVLSAMVKIATPFFHWEKWFPDWMALFSQVWPSGGALGGPSEGFTIIVLMLIVGVYSSLGGLRGVIFTDMVQFIMALTGSIWMAVLAWNAVGGSNGIIEGMQKWYPNEHLLEFLPATQSGWLAALDIGGGLFFMYLIVQSFSNINADGGGYIMQRLSSTKNAEEARKASFIFIVFHYLIRIWPWFIVAVAALIIIPKGQETVVFEGAAAKVATDRELAYPFLMSHLLGPGALGLLITSLLAAFMSTVDTHINWGASYVVNDWLMKLKPDASEKLQIRVARYTVLLYALLAITIALQIGTIEKAWEYILYIGAAMGLPTLARWLWWRISASSEIGALLLGLGTAIFLANATTWPYEIRLFITACSSLTGMLLGTFVGPKTEPEVLKKFARQVQPKGLWPMKDHTPSESFHKFILQWLGLVSGVLMTFYAGQRILFHAEWLKGLVLITLGLVVICWSFFHRSATTDTHSPRQPVV